MTHREPRGRVKNILFLRNDGVTLVELMIAIAVAGVLALAAPALFRLALWDLSNLEAHSAMKSAAQATINNIGATLTQSKRIFQNNSSDNLFLSHVGLGSAPAAIAGSALPVVNTYGSLSPSSGSFSAADVGNCLFIASVAPAIDNLVHNGLGSTETIRIDTYQFNYYYLAQAPSGTMGSKAKIDLWEWHSVSYADADEITAIADATASSNTIRALAAAGIQYAWSPSTPTFSAAFFQISSTTMAAQPNHTIQVSSSDKMLNLLVGSMSSGFHFSVSPNTGNGFNTNTTVPLFATASNQFPSGFEIAMIGPNTARQVFMRLVLVAQGAFSSSNYVTHEVSVVMTARDLW
jgi:prepilin-type N-terminal cleavage/methylation domain-containing protein